MATPRQDDLHDEALREEKNIDIEFRNTIGSAVTGRPHEEHQPVVVGGDSREPLSNLIHYTLRLHLPICPGR